MSKSYFSPFYGSPCNGWLADDCILPKIIYSTHTDALAATYKAHGIDPLNPPTFFQPAEDPSGFYITDLRNGQIGYFIDFDTAVTESQKAYGIFGYDDEVALAKLLQNKKDKVNIF